MFDDAFGMASLCTDAFQDSVHDVFGNSVLENVLAPILQEIASLRTFHEEFQNQSLTIESLLDEVRMMQFSDGSI